MSELFPVSSAGVLGGETEARGARKPLYVDMEISVPC